MSNEAYAGLGLIIFVAALIIGGPLATIWALNTLFSLTIPTTFWTWLATLWLMWTVSGTKTASKV